jgi:hypothetical protein
MRIEVYMAGMRRPREVALMAAMGLLPMLLIPSGGAAQQPPSPNQSAVVQEGFERRVAAYVKLHRQMQSELPALKETHSAAEITRHRADLALKIRAARAHARQGEIFTPAVSAEFRRLIARSMRGPQGRRILASLKRAKPVNLNVSVNQTYPAAAPLQSMPPTLLSNLPRLPPELDYRLAGRDLILRDTEANLVVDVIREALP